MAKARMYGYQKAYKPNNQDNRWLRKQEPLQGCSGLKNKLDKERRNKNS